MNLKVMFYRFGVVTSRHLQFISGFLCIMQPVLLGTTNRAVSHSPPCLQYLDQKILVLKGHPQGL